MSTEPTLLIVGGVAGGATAATRARRMNERARIILLERDATVSYANCGLPYFVGDEITSVDRLMLATPALFARRYNIEVRTGHEVRAIDRERQKLQVCDLATNMDYDIGYDRLILATGARPIVPAGLVSTEAENVFTLRTLADAERLRRWVDGMQPRRVLVAGASFIGLEVVEQLVRRKIEVTLVDMASHVLPTLDADLADVLEEELVRQGVRLRTGESLARVDAGGQVTLGSGETLTVDGVVLGLGVRPNTALGQAAGLRIGPTGALAVNRFMQTSDPLIYAVGDVAEMSHRLTHRPIITGLAGPAHRAARTAGEHAVTGEARPVAPVLGTAIVRVFGLTAARTGLSQHDAQLEGWPAEVVAVEAGHHAGFYPGARAMLLKLVFCPHTGQILGAQAVGPEGVDKRIDVLATALQMGATVEDLAELDLAYAPPFSSAKDPVHLVGMAASNRCAELVNFVTPDHSLGLMQVVDVRTAAEVAARPLVGAVHIPLEELRGRLRELNKKVPTVAVCQAGMRGYLAARILTQNGFEHVSDMTGGMAFLRHVKRALEPVGEPW